MVILAIETATPACSVALSTENKVTQRHQVLPRQHSNLVLTYVDELLTESGCSLSSVDMIACGVGPGSFMGVRLAVSVVQGLAFARTIPVVPLSTLHIVAQTAYLNYGLDRVTVIWDARMNEVYVGDYQCNAAGVMQPSQPDRLLKPAECQSNKDGICVVGNGMQAYPEAFTEHFVQRVARSELCYPEAKAMVPLAMHLQQHKEGISARDLQPVYLRSPV